MPRGKDRKEIRDFSYGMDSTNYPGVIAEELSRMPLMYNWRIRENGRAIRRGGYLKEASDVYSGVDFVTTALAQSTVNNLKYVYLQTSAPDAEVSSVFSVRTDNYEQQTIMDYAGYPATRVAGYNTSDDGDGHLYSGGWSAGLFDNSGGVIDVDAQRHRQWGIFRPLEAARVVGLIDGDPYDDIEPATSPTDPGWFYFYTYARIVSGEIVAESAPSPLMNQRFAPTTSCTHKVTVRLSTDPQVTHIRFFRTTGEITGFEDGTAPGTAALVQEIAVGSLYDINIGGEFNSAFSSALSTTPDANPDYKCAIFTNSYPASLLNLLDTWGTAAYGEPSGFGAPFTPQGDWTLCYKEALLAYGNVTAYGTHAGNRVYYTDNRAGLKYKSSFYGWMDFPNTITAAFVYKNDIIICTTTQTYRVVDGNWTQVRLTVDGIGVLANNSCDFDPSNNLTLALTNKGVRGFNGTDWTADLSYQIKSEIQTVTQVVSSTVALASGAVINREYYLALRGSFDPLNYPVDPIVCVGFLQNNGTISWTVDTFETNCYVQGSIMMNTKVSSNESSYNEYPLALMRVGSIQQNHLIGIEQAYGRDFGTDKISARLRIPRLIHQSLDNNIRVKYIKIIGNMYLPYNYTGTLPAITSKATGDNGRTYQPIKIVNNAIESPLDSYKYA